MGFKSVEEYDEELYRNKFRIPRDGMTADVIFLYRSKRDMLQATTHYIKSSTYSGYVHCLGEGCPVCARKKADGSNVYRVQSKLFIPLYNIQKNGGVIEFWDRNYNQGFINQLDRDVFEKSPNPSECVFTIKRHGDYRDTETRYDFVAAGWNKIMSYDQILAKFNATMPEYYENIVKSASAEELEELLKNQISDNHNSSISQDYVPVPRAGYQSSIPNTYVNATEAVGNAPEAPDSHDAILSEFDDVSDDNGELPDPVF